MNLSHDIRDPNTAKLSNCLEGRLLHVFILIIQITG